MMNYMIMQSNCITCSQDAPESLTLFAQSTTGIGLPFGNFTTLSRYVFQISTLYIKQYKCSHSIFVVNLVKQTAITRMSAKSQLSLWFGYSYGPSVSEHPIAAV